MADEKQLQKWFVERAKRCMLGSAIQGYNVRNTHRNESDLPPESNLDLTDELTRKALQNIDLVLESLTDADFVSADESLKLETGETLKPDLLLHDRDSGAWIIIELKVTAAAARQTITELVGYAQALQHKYHNPPVHLVIASQEWRPLLEHAVRHQLHYGKYPLLPLTVIPIQKTKDVPLDYDLNIRWTSLKHESSKVDVTPESIVCDIKAYYFLSDNYRTCPELQRIEQLIIEKTYALARQADPERIGFILVSRHPGLVWQVMTCIVNPARLPTNVSEDSPIHRYLNPYTDPDFPDTPEPSNIDYGWKLLEQIGIEDSKLGNDLSGFSTWTQAQMALTRSPVIYLFAAGWGRTTELFSNTASVPQMSDATNIDLGKFRDYHPFHWVPKLDQLCGTVFDTCDLSALYQIHALGRALGAVAYYYSTESVATEEADDFGYLLAMARLIDVWPRVYETFVRTHPESPPPIRLRFERTDGTQLTHLNIDHLLRWSKKTLCAASKWHNLAFELGVTQAYAERFRGVSEVELAPDQVLRSTIDELFGWAQNAPEVQKDHYAHQALEYILHIFRVLGNHNDIAALAVSSRHVCDALIELANIAISAPSSVGDTE